VLHLECLRPALVAADHPSDARLSAPVSPGSVALYLWEWGCRIQHWYQCYGRCL